MLSHSTPSDALNLLKAGNERFVSGKPEAAPYGLRVAEFAADEHPFAVILGCSDARVPIGTIFDQAPGNLFVVRVAGNFVNDDNLASMELAVEILKAPLVLVLGHSNCGAIRAAIAHVQKGASLRGHIPQLVDKLVPSVRATRELPGDWRDNAIAHNVDRNIAAILETSTIISDAAHAGEIKVSGGIYDIMTGQVAFR